MTLEGYTSNFPDSDLIPSNIKDGVEIFGVTGNYEGVYPTTGSGSGFMFAGPSQGDATPASAYCIINDGTNYVIVAGRTIGQLNGGDRYGYISVYMIRKSDGLVKQNWMSITDVAYFSGGIKVNDTDGAIKFPASSVLYDRYYHFDTNTFDDVSIGTFVDAGSNISEDSTSDIDVTFGGYTYSLEKKDIGDGGSKCILFNVIGV